VSASDVGVVIVSYETRDRTLACVESALADTSAAKRVVVVDNASTDGTADALRERFGEDVDIVAGARNVGFGSACNTGSARVSDVRHVLFLNADTRVRPGALGALVAALDDGAGAAGPAIVGDDGEAQPSVRGHPTRLALLHQHTALRFLRVGVAAYGRYKRPECEPDAVPVVMGAALAVHGDVLRSLGGFDERYFLYFEEADLCRRVADSGRAVRFVDAAVVEHAGGASSDPRRGPALIWYLDSLFAYVDRFHGRGAGVLYRVVFKPLFVLRMVTDLIRDLLTWTFRPGKRFDKAPELRLAAWFFTRGLGPFLAA
jgi:GT2 family glycosyltransferase